MEKEETKNKIEEFRNSQLLQIVNLATLVSIAMLFFYGLGAYKHLKEIKKIK